MVTKTGAARLSPPVHRVLASAFTHWWAASKRLFVPPADLSTYPSPSSLLVSFSIVDCAIQTSTMAPSAKSFWSEMITVLVGPSKEKFILHKAVLIRMPYFEACLRNNMKESREGVVRLPEDDPAAFSEVAYWIYHGKFEQDLGSEAQKGSKKGPLPETSQIDKVLVRFKTYLLAKKMMVEELQNNVIDSLHLIFKQIFPGARILSLVYDNFEPDDILRSFTTRMLAYMIINKGGWKAWKDKEKIHYDTFMFEEAAHLEWALEAVTDYPKDSHPAWSLPACKWHVQTTTTHCSK